MGHSRRGERSAQSERRRTAEQQPGIDPETLARWYRQMVLVRRFEEQAERSYRRGKIGGYLHLYTGQEAVAIGALAALRDDDVVFTGYRDHAHALVRGTDPNAVMAELYGKATGVCKGKGGSMHLVDVAHGVYGGYGIVAGHIPLAVGAAFALRYLGTDRLCCCFLGDGAMNNGAFHEPANLAGLWGHDGRCPIVFVLENNLYGMGTHVARASAVRALRSRFAAYGIPCAECNGMDILAVHQAVARAVEEARRTGGPHAVEAMTYRFAAHGAADLLQAYREKREIEAWRTRDPLAALEHRLRDEGGWDDGRVAEVSAWAEEQVQAAVAFADRSPAPRPEELFTDVFAPAAPPTAPAVAGSDGARSASAHADGAPPAGGEALHDPAHAAAGAPGGEVTYRDALRAALTEAMDRDGHVLLLGEDIGVYGGTFRITEGLLRRYGAQRVVDTPISELGFIGAAIGMAMLGLRPVVEVMTWNFALGAADQIIQNAAKVRYFSGGQLEVPLVIRGPSGAGVQLSAQHSQAFESFYGHFPGLVVVSPATAAEAYDLLRAAIDTPDPVLVLESAALYGTKGRLAPGNAPGIAPGALRLRPGRDVTLVAYGRLLPLALKTAARLEEEQIECEVIELRSFRPLDLDAVADSVRRTHRAVVVQEQWPRYGVAAEVAAQIYERCFDDLDAPVERVTGADVPMPYAAALEALAMPDETAIADAVRRSFA